MKKNNSMKYHKLMYTLLCLSCLWLVIYQSRLGEPLTGKTNKHYFYDDQHRVIFTVILFTGTIWESEIKVNEKNGLAYFENGMGLYLIPGKFTGRLPTQNYVRIDYRGDDLEPIYYKYSNDSLFFRIPYRSSDIIENKLPGNVILDSLILKYERYGMYYKKDTAQIIEEYREWKKMRNEYNHFYLSDIE